MDKLIIKHLSTALFIYYKYIDIRHNIFFPVHGTAPLSPSAQELCIRHAYMLPQVCILPKTLPCKRFFISHILIFFDKNMIIKQIPYKNHFSKMTFLIKHPLFQLQTDLILIVFQGISHSIVCPKAGIVYIEACIPFCLFPSIVYQSHILWDNRNSQVSASNKPLFYLNNVSSI